MGRHLRLVLVAPARGRRRYGRAGRAHALPGDLQLQPALGVRVPGADGGVRRRGAPRGHPHRRLVPARVRRHPPRPPALAGGRELPHHPRQRLRRVRARHRVAGGAGPVGPDRAAARAVGGPARGGGGLSARRHHPVAARDAAQRELLAGLPVREPRGHLRRVHAHDLLHLARLGLGGRAIVRHEEHPDHPERGRHRSGADPCDRRHRERVDERRDARVRARGPRARPHRLELLHVPDHPGRRVADPAVDPLEPGADAGAARRPRLAGDGQHPRRGRHAPARRGVPHRSQDRLVEPRLSGPTTRRRARSASS